MQKAIEKIMSEVTDECVITSCGFISREVFRAKDRDRNFYNMGAMGTSLAIGLGLARSRPDLKVIVISGDGAVLMSAGTLALQHYLNLDNLTHYILTNFTYASTGGQPNCAMNLPVGQSKTIFVGNDSDAPRVPLSCKTIKERFVESIRIRD